MSALGSMVLQFATPQPCFVSLMGSLTPQGEPQWKLTGLLLGSYEVGRCFLVSFGGEGGFQDITIIVNPYSCLCQIRYSIEGLLASVV